MIVVYGILGSEDNHIDVSNTERGAKSYATRHGYNKVSKRVGYNACVVSEKVNGKWVKPD